MGPPCTYGFGIREKNLMRFVVFWRISARFCSFQTPLTSPQSACRTHFHMKGFALRPVLKQRHRRTRKWPIAGESNWKKIKWNPLLPVH